MVRAAILAVLGCALLVGAPAEARNAERIPVIVALQPVRTTQAAGASVAALQDAVLRRLPASDFKLTYRFQTLSGFAGFVTPAGLKQLREDPNVSRVSRDLPGRATDLESSVLIRADVAQAEGFSGVGSTVAVLDSGIDATHPDLATAVVGQHCFCTKADGSGCCPAGVKESDDGSDEEGHGTRVAGIIAGAGGLGPVGVAPGAKLVSVRVLDADGRFAMSSQVIMGLDWVLTNRPDVNVVNMSLSTNRLFDAPCDVISEWTSPIELLRARGTVVVASSGNQGSTSQLPMPACVSNALTVGAVYDADFGPYESSLCREEGTAADKVTCFSNSGPGVDVLAPGAQITTTARGPRLVEFSGTSASAPHVAGAAAVLMAARPDAGVAQIEEALKATGTPITDPRNGIVTPRIDVAAALELLRAAEPQAARAELSRSSLAFGRVRAGRSKTLTFRVANTGNLNLTVVGTTRSPFRVRGLPVVLAPGGARTVRVTFRPTARRAYTGTLRLITGDPERPTVNVRLRGTGTH